MEFNAMIDLIIKDLDEARAIIDDFKRYPGVPALQVELAKAKCKSAGEIIAILKNHRNQVTIEEKKEQLVPEPEKKEVPAKKTPIIPKPEAGLQPPVFKKDVQNQPAEKSAESTIIADTFNLSNRFNEQLGNLKEEEDLTEILKSKHLSNLSEAIGINDKFLFLREIFNDNLDSYVQAISRLDHVDNIEDAKAVIMSYSGDDSDDGAVKQLLDLVKRKLHTDE